MRLRGGERQGVHEKGAASPGEGTGRVPTGLAGGGGDLELQVRQGSTASVPSSPAASPATLSTTCRPPAISALLGPGHATPPAPPAPALTPSEAPPSSQAMTQGRTPRQSLLQLGLFPWLPLQVEGHPRRHGLTLPASRHRPHAGPASRRPILSPRGPRLTSDSAVAAWKF